MNPMIKFFTKSWSKANILALLGLIIGIAGIFANQNYQNPSDQSGNNKNIQITTCGNAPITTNGDNSGVNCGNVQIKISRED